MAYLPEKIYSGTPLYFVSLAITLLTLNVALFVTPIVIRFSLNFFSPRKILEKLEKRIKKSVDQKSVTDVRTLLAALNFMAQEAVESGDSLLFDRTIDSEVNILNYVIDNHEKIHENLEKFYGMTEKTPGYMWVFRDVLSTMMDGFTHALHKEHFDMANYVCRGVCAGGLTSLHYSDKTNHAIQMSEMMGKIIRISIGNKYIKTTDIMQSFRMFFTTVLALPPSESEIILHSFYQHELIVELITKTPWEMSNVNSLFFEQMKNVGTYLKTNIENIALVVQNICTTIETAKALQKIGSISDVIIRKEIALFVARECKKLFILGLFSEFNSQKELSRIIRGMLEEYCNIDSLCKAMQSTSAKEEFNFIDFDSWFGEYDASGNTRHFNEKKFSGALKSFSA
jgi:hypothetical protein